MTQRSLFEDEELPPWEADEATQGHVASVVFTEGPPGPFDYRVPPTLRDRVEPGQRLWVPFGRGNRRRIGYCVQLEVRRIDRPLKEVAGVVDRRSLLSGTMIRVTRWIAQRYLSTWGQVLEAVLPAGVRQQAGTRTDALLVVPDEVRRQAGTLELPRQQAAALACLIAADEPMTVTQLARVARCTPGPIQQLRKKGLVQVQRRRVRRVLEADTAVAREPNLPLTAQQQQALAAIEESLRRARHATILLYGATGSGKTEVYLQAAQQVAAGGRQAIVLVPEISLTPQTVQRFRSRFDRVAVLHSHLSDSQRHHHWQEIADGRVQVVVGARSAVFAPTPRLGLIVVDEEHESSFKQEQAPRYHAREVALHRAQLEQVPLVLGSATPSLESWHRAMHGDYELVQMPQRVFDRPLPRVGILDMRDDAQTRGAGGVLSRRLQAAMSEALADGGQVMLLLNRRGYSTHIQCPACGQAMRCPDCDIALTYHRSGETVLCHYCEHQQPAPRRCPACHFAGIRFAGIGTQRLEAEVRSRFPDAPCVRMDTDSMRRPGSHEQALDRFRRGEVRILLGTQMIAKGLDFPEVTLVGVINADVALHLPDFRAAERTFQLLAQVAGRTGRGPRGGRVLVQTLSPDHPAIQAAARHDFAAFAAHELPLRQALGYPPYTSLVRLVVRGPVQAVCEAFARHLGDGLRGALAAVPESRALGPVAAPLPRLKTLYRFQLLAQAPDGEALRAAVAAATADLRPPEGVAWMADVDPLNML